MSALASNLSFSFPPTKTSRLVPVHGFLLKKKSHFGQNSGRPPLRNVRAYKVQVGPIETVDHCHVTANGRPPACPATFILWARGEHSASSRLKPYLTLPNSNFKGRWKRQNFDFEKTEILCWCSNVWKQWLYVVWGWISWESVGSARKTKWRRHLPNPFPKRGEMRLYLSQFERGHFRWPECQIPSCLDSSAVYFGFIIWPWKFSSINRL